MRSDNSSSGSVLCTFAQQSPPPPTHSAAHPHLLNLAPVVRAFFGGPYSTFGPSACAGQGKDGKPSGRAPLFIEDMELVAEAEAQVCVCVSACVCTHMEWLTVLQ
jgi:hypothetical protein